MSNKPRGAARRGVAQFLISAYGRGMKRFQLASPLGALGEELASRYLKDKGYQILATNYCNVKGKRLGEIDIVAEYQGELVFVEVKSRLKGADGDVLPEAGITRDKLRKLARIAECYLRETKRESAPYHFDGMAVLYDPLQKMAQIRHLEHIFF
jgi:putative endonuclease